jgi:sugar lactone lactonase YvrE
MGPTCLRLSFVATALSACAPGGGESLNDAGMLKSDVGTLTFDVAPHHEDASPEDASSGAPDATAATDASLMRGPTSIMSAFDPEGLWWDPASETLYIADQENNQVLTWTDAAGFKTFSTLPGGAQAAEDLGQIVLTSQGDLFVIVFGFGTNGAIDVVSKDGTASTVAGLDPSFRRLGLTEGPDGTFYESYFVKNASGSAYVGTVAKLSLTSSGGAWSGTETTFVTGLSKPVGVLVSGSSLYISDQGTNDFYSVPLASPPTSTPTVLGSNLALDLVSLGPDGTFFSGSSSGDLERITASGMESIFVSGYANPRGSAFDAAHNRVFFGNHITSGGQNALVIVPGP